MNGLVYRRQRRAKSGPTQYRPISANTDDGDQSFEVSEQGSLIPMLEVIR
jgi:hypothetical protein